MKSFTLNLVKYWSDSQHSPQNRTAVGKNDGEGGFTLLEVLIVVIMIGILGAIGIPSWLSMVNNTKLKKAIGPIEQAIVQAQNKAQQQKSTWRASFKQDTPSGPVYWAVHPEADPSSLSPSTWQKIDTETNVVIDTANTTLGGASSPYSIQFDDKGNVLNDDNLPERITLTLQSNSSKKRCVKVVTLLGSLRTAQNSDCTTP